MEVIAEKGGDYAPTFANARDPTVAGPLASSHFGTSALPQCREAVASSARESLRMSSPVVTIASELPVHRVTRRMQHCSARRSRCAVTGNRTGSGNHGLKQHSLTASQPQAATEASPTAATQRKQECVSV